MNAATSWLCDLPYGRSLDLSEISVLGANAVIYACLLSCWRNEPLSESPQNHVVSYDAFSPQCPAA